MSSTLNPSFNSPPPSRQPAFHASPAISASSAPAGTFVPGTKVQVGNHRVIIEKYLSEGGFAHVYSVRLPKPIDGGTGAVLKRVAVADKDSLAEMRAEVETMKKLKGHRHIVTYIDSHASQLKGGGYEVFLLMEYCAGGGLIDYMNTRLQSRLTEPEILKIFSDAAEGVACMHYLKPPLLHRDLKVENILISSSSTSRQYKLCDFGSAAPPRPAATSAAEGRLIEDDVQKHTTLQYRSPEMIDVYRKQPIDEKSDIWALGVLLYKLSYYTTPFEDQGQMAILNASFKFPAYPPFTDRLKKLIASMLRESPQLRPNIYQVVAEVCAMRGTDIPIKDIYRNRPASEARRNQHLPSPEPNVASPPTAGAFKGPIVEERRSVPDIVPMRRGRPTKAVSDHTAPKPSPSPLRGSVDPFAALDSKPAPVSESASLDDISARFPPLDEFSLLHDTGGKFAFEQDSPTLNTQPKGIQQRVTEALADDAFAQPSTSTKSMSTQSKSLPASQGGERYLSQRGPPTTTKPHQSPLIIEPASQKPTMVSTGTMTSPSPPQSAHEASSSSSHPIFRFPSHEHRSSSQSRLPDSSNNLSTSQGADALGITRPTILDHRSKSQTATLRTSKSPASSRPSLEGQRPLALDLDNSLSRSKSTTSRSRPSSEYVAAHRNFLRSRESSLSRGKTALDSSLAHIPGTERLVGGSDSSNDEGDLNKISSNVDFLRAMEEEDPDKRKEKRRSSGSRHIKRSSMPAISLSNTKSLLAGRFGDAFRRFEASNTKERAPSQSPDRRGRELTPIAGSEATDGRSDDGQVVEETQEIPPEVRRELERRRLSQEEKRVADAAAAYKQRLAERGDNGRRSAPAGPMNKAASIQSKVQSLLDESGRSSPTKIAEGYGRFTHSPDRSSSRQAQEPTTTATATSSASGPVSRKPLPTNPISKASPKSSLPTDPSIATKIRQPATTTAAIRPTAPPKPHALRTGGRADGSLASPLGVSTRSTQQDDVGDGGSEVAIVNGDGVNENWEASFVKRYPTLSKLEMVETEIERGREK